MLAVAPDAFRLVAGCHQDGVVHRGTQLNRADADGGDEGQRLPEIMRQAEVDEDGQLNDRNEQEGKRNALLDQQNDDENCEDGDGVVYPEVVVGRFDHVLHARRFADKHSGRIVFLEYTVEAVDLRVYIVARYLVFRVYKQKLPFVAFQYTAYAVGKYLLRNA